MKFPTAEPLFPSLSPTPAECTRYELLARAIVHDTVADYDQYVREHQRQVSKQRWKGVKSREDIAVYKARDHNSQDNIHRGLASGLTRSTATGSDAVTPELLEHFPAVEYNLPKLLMVGTISGTLDDVMYGLSTHDSSSILLKAAYTQDEIVDGQILYQFEGPSPARPYKFLGIKWVVKGNPVVVNSIVAPRDLLFLNTIGILNRGDDNDERLGYFLLHSVELPEVPSLHRQHGIIRGRLSTSYVFKQLRDDCVEVYMKGYVEPAGKLVESVAINSAVTGLLFCWKAVVCSQSKKLVWMLKQKAALKEITASNASASFVSSSVSKFSMAVPPFCGLCHRDLKAYNSSVECELCDLPMCSRCRVTLKLCFEKVGAKQVEQRSVVFCKSCTTRAHQANTLQIAMDEVRSGRFGLSFSSSEGSSDVWDPHRKFSTASSMDTSTNTTATKTTKASSKLIRINADRTVSVAETAKTYPYSEERFRSGDAGGSELVLTTSSSDRDAMMRRRMMRRDLYEHEAKDKRSAGDRVQQQQQQRRHPETEDGSYRGWSPEKQELWRRMEQLKMQADDVYLFTKNSLNAMPPSPHEHQPEYQYVRESID
ncbi:hypothetical protein Gpo141_00012817 [Globisporangium polare]